MKKKSLPTPEHFLHRACNLGAIEAKVISPQHIFTAEWVRRKCQYGCDGFGEHLTCPPYSPTPQETRRLLDEYKIALLIHCPSRGVEVLKIICTLEREAFLAGYYKAFGMSAGPCSLCEKCNTFRKHVVTLNRHVPLWKPAVSMSIKQQGLRGILLRWSKTIVALKTIMDYYYLNKEHNYPKTTILFFSF